MARSKSISIILIIAGLQFSNSTQAQESFNTSGGDAKGNGGTASYSLGQLVYTSNTSSLAQGVQHAYEISVVGIKETELKISLIVFPNPTAENLILQIGDLNNQKFLYQLFDIEGKQLICGLIVSQNTQINTNSLPPATYFIKILNQENKLIQSFKIIKKS